MIQADKTMHNRVEQAIRYDLANNLKVRIRAYNPVAENLPKNYQIGDIEDANVLIQNSLWLNVPLGRLDGHDQVVTLQDRRRWAKNQLVQIELIRSKFDDTANIISHVCI